MERIERPPKLPNPSRQHVRGACSHVILTAPKDVFGRKLPYGHGLSGCSELQDGVGYYPFQINTCPHFYHADD